MTVAQNAGHSSPLVISSYMHMQWSACNRHDQMLNNLSLILRVHVPIYSQDSVLPTWLYPCICDISICQMDLKLSRDLEKLMWYNNACPSDYKNSGSNTALYINKCIYNSSQGQKLHWTVLKAQIFLLQIDVCFPRCKLPCLIPPDGILYPVCAADTSFGFHNFWSGTNFTMERQSRTEQRFFGSSLYLHVFEHFPCTIFAPSTSSLTSYLNLSFSTYQIYTRIVIYMRCLSLSIIVSALQSIHRCKEGRQDPKHCRAPCQMVKFT